jgi:hypothetical protein
MTAKPVLTASLCVCTIVEDFLVTVTSTSIWELSDYRKY